MSGPNWTVLHDMDHQFDSQCPECQQWLAEAIRDYLRSPAAKEALAEAIDSCPWPESTSSLGYGSRIWINQFARAILKAWQP